MNLEDQLIAEEIIAELERRRVRNKIDQFYATPENRAGYPVHMEFFEAGKSYRERCCVSANRTGKTEGILCYEVSLHLTGLYPEWWTGRRFAKPVHGWLGGDTATTVRDILQQKLLGDVGNFGTGLIRADLIVDTTNKRGVPDAVEIIKVKHVSGGVSVVAMKSYDQGRTAWQGTEQDFVGLDEEPPEDIYSEAVIRTMTTGGMILCTYTPMYGMSELTQSFFDIDKAGSKFVCTATWDNVLHLSKEMKDELWKSIPIHERDARAKGIPTIGVGKIYPVDLQSMTIEPIQLPKHWMRGYALDVGWNKTAALWGALDRDSDTLYLYSEHYQGEAEPAVHASAIKSRGALVGQIDPASRGRSQHDGKKLIQLYRNEGLTLVEADNAVETGIFEVYQRMTTGRLKIFNTCANLLKELPLYHRDKNGQIVKKNDHACDCFHGDTLVKTDMGDIPIRNLVGTEGYVLTSSGQYEKYHSCLQYGENSAMIRLTYADGKSVVCTPDHKFMTENGGWVSAIDMLGKVGFNITNGVLWKSKKSMKNNSNFSVKRIGYVDSIFNDTVSGFIEKCGNTITERLLKVFIFITKTKTEAIMPYRIWKFFLSMTIFRFIQKARKTPTFILQSKKQKNGMRVMKAENGISNTWTCTANQFTRKFLLLAISAAKNMKQSIMELTASVQTIVNQRLGVQVVLTTSQPHVQFAEMISKKVGTQSSVLAVSNAAQSYEKERVVKIEHAENADSYCLTVDSTHDFAILDGMIVHNCLRYLCNGINTLSYSAEEDGHYSVTNDGTRYLSSRPNRPHRHYR